MTSTEFNSLIVSRLRAINDGSTISEPHTVLKNNGVKLTGITVTPEDSSVGITIYLEDAFKQYSAGVPIDSIVDKINRVTSLSPPAGIESVAQHLRDKDYVREHLRIKVVNAETNEAMLADSVYRQIEDLAAIAVLEVDSGNDGIGTIRITTDFLTELRLTKDEVMRMAMKQNDATEYTMRTIEEAILDTLGIDVAPEDFPKPSIPMYVITSPSNCFGAAILASSKQLDKIVSALNEDVYVLPSSVHEIILVPKRIGSSLEELRNIVRAVNTEEVSAEELLSNEVYEYNARTHKLVIAGDSIYQEQDYISPQVTKHM